MIILGIETSCDDTSLAILENNKTIKQFKISSESILKKYGGIIPEIASRKHEQAIIDILNELKKEFDFSKIDKIAYTSFPGLLGSLHVGKIFAETLGLILKKDVIPINHIYGHIFSCFIDKNAEIKYPFLSLIASGGTTSIFLVKNINEIIELNKTSDDAIGEAFDKIGRILGLEYPGGPSIDKIYNRNLIIPNMFTFPKPQDHFSFSGIKTKIANIVNNLKMKNEPINVELLASNFQYWAIKTLIDKIKYYSEKNNINLISIGGGVSSNSLFRELIDELNLEVLKPNKKYSCDNGAMIALIGYLKSINNM